MRVYICVSMGMIGAKHNAVVILFEKHRPHYHFSDITSLQINLYGQIYT